MPVIPELTDEHGEQDSWRLLASQARKSFKLDQEDMHVCAHTHTHTIVRIK